MNHISNYTLPIFAITTLVLMSFSMTGDLGQALAQMEKGSSLFLEYNFEGCYGPYHHGSVEFNLIEDTVHFTERNYNENGVEGITQSGKYERSYLLSLIEDINKTSSQEILGNHINYHIKRNDTILSRGKDKIEQAHFIAIFRPFSSVFPSKKQTIPGLKTGGFVH